MMEELWKDVPGYGGKYQASTHGNVRGWCKVGGGNRWGNSQSKLKIIRQYLDPKGYLRMNIVFGEKTRPQFIHRVIATTFLGESPFPGAQVNHKDYNRQNNAVENLEWVTPKQNVLHTVLGDRHNFSKLKQSEILDIRVQYSDFVQDLVKKYGVSEETLKRIFFGDARKE